MSSATNWRAELLQQLRQLGVETVTAEYSGFGDSGQIDDPEFESIEAPPAVAKAVQDLFYDFLEELYAGWEINEGSFGNFIWNVSVDRINLAHTTMTESTEEQNL